MMILRMTWKNLPDSGSFNSNVDFAGRIILDENGVEIFNFGKHKGKELRMFSGKTGILFVDDERRFSSLYKKNLTEIKLRAFGK